MKKRIITTVLVIAMGSTLLFGCGANSEATSASSDADASSSADTSKSDDSSNSATSSSGEVRTIKVAFGQTGVPYGYVDDDGNATGYDVEVLKLVDEALEDYEFEFVPTDAQDAWAGAAEGKYQIAITNSFYTAERAEKYIIPETHLGASIGVLIYRKGEGPYTSWEDVANSGVSLVPIKSGDGWQFLVEDYNAKNPDNQINLELTDSQDWAAGLGYVAEGRYDVFGTVLTSWENNVVAEDGDYHNLYDQLEATQFTSVKTYTLINQDEQDLADKINEQLQELHASGKTAEISEEFYGYNVLEYVED